MNIITCPKSLKKFFITLNLIFLLTKPQQNNLESIVISAVQGGFDGKIKNVPELSSRNIHRTTIGRFLSNSKWPTHLVIDNYQQYVIERIRKEAATTNAAIIISIDDTISEKTKPSSKAKKPIEGCSFHQSHLKKKSVYGHQIFTVLIECGKLKLPYYMALYDKAKESKITMACKTIEAMPKLPGKVYVLGDSWYSAVKVIKAAKSKGFCYIGALKNNRVFHTPGGMKIGQNVKNHAKTLSKQDVNLVTVGNRKYWGHRVNGAIKNLPKNGVLLLTWPEDKLFEEKFIRVFFSTENLSNEEILRIYTERWSVEVFFRNSKMQLKLEQYQIRKKQAITRFLLLIMITYAYCNQLLIDNSNSLDISRKIARAEIKTKYVEWIFNQAQNGISLSKIYSSLGLAS